MGKHITPMKAIRLKCLECSCNQWKEVKLCPITDCPLYELRFGHIPWRKHDYKENGTSEENDAVEDGSDYFMNSPEDFTEDDAETEELMTLYAVDDQ